MTTTTISSGVTSSGLTVSSGDQLIVLSGGVVDSSTVLGGGAETISDGGHASGIDVASGATLSVYAGTNPSEELSRRAARRSSLA